MINIEIERLAAKADEAARLLTVMANSKRLLILCNLLERDMNVAELEARVGLAQSPLSQHLSRLRARDLVRARRQGQQVFYSIASDDVRQVLATLYGIYCRD